MAIKIRVGSLFQLAVAVGVAASPSSQLSAQDETAKVEKEVVIEEIVVTGSRIKRSNINAPTPIMSLGAQDIEASGNIELSRIVRELPSVYEGTSTENSQSSTQNSGSATVELRNLGQDRTLVLIDGKRTVSNSSTNNVVSLDTIPTGFIERVEVITGGASAVYGSDAVTGVVNIITKDDYEGVEFSLRAGDSEDGGGEEQVFTLTAGANFNDERSNLLVNFTYDDGGPIFGKDRDWSTVAVDIDGDPALSSNIPGGRYLGRDWYYDPNTNELLQDFDSDTAGFNDRFDYMMRIQKKRNLLAVKFRHELTENLRFILHSQYAHVETLSNRAPDTANSSRLSTEIPLDNPFIPDPILQQAIAEGESGIDFRRRWTEIGRRLRGGDRDTTRTWLSLEGDINEDWSWSAYYGFHQFRQSQNRRGDLVVPKFRDAVNVIPDPDNPGEYMCEDERARIGGCVPINIFGIGSVTPEAINWVVYQDALRAENEETNAGIFVNGSFLDLPAGSVGMAAGLEYRDVSTSTRWDPIANGGLGTVTQQVDQDGEFDVSEAYVEFIVPVFDGFDFEAAYRAARYDQPTVDDTSSWKAGFSWQIIDDIRLRAMFATAERAPNTIELFSRGIGNQGGLDDPCDGVTATSQGVIDDNCRSVPSVAANIAANGSFTRDVTDQIQAPLSGNELLKEEEAETFTVGLVFTPDFVEGLSVSIDYYDIEIEDAISSFDEQDVLFLCYEDPGFPNNDFCPQINRETDTGELFLIDRGEINVNTLLAKGIDTSVTWEFEPGFIPGSMRFRLDHSYVDTLEEEFNAPGGGVEIDKQVGEVETPEYRARGSLSWTNGPWFVRWKTRFWGEATDGAELADGSVLDVDDHWINDVYASYDTEFFNANTTFFVGVNNIFDEEPPELLDGSEFGNTVNTNTQYDIVGRYWYVGLTSRF